MRLATVLWEGVARGVLVLPDEGLLDFALAAADLSGPDAEALRAGKIQAVIEGGPGAASLLREIAAAAVRGDHSGARLDGTPPWCPPLRPRKNVLCVGRNYAEHIAEGDRAQNRSVGVTEHPVFFTKPPTAVIGHGDEVLVFPSVSTAMDYEVELAVVIGTAGRSIAPENAMDHVFGYTILNDVTARDVQRRHGGQYFKGKGLDASCPIGPWIVTADEIADPHDLRIGLTVNGETRQDGTTRDMIFDIPTIIASLSAGMMLEPGDIIATGTPSGVGYAMEPPRFLKAGDRMVCTVGGIGTLENTVRDA
jgi:2-keto-4-pentenoate hydratase/2-oxohepta-3-ene-1,7-dioic acid hydratase in catechol pathway